MHEADFAAITLAIRRLLDSEVIEAEAGAMLLAETESGRRLLETGEEEAARQHAEHLASLIVALVGSGDLDLLDGRAVIQSVGEALSASPMPSHTEDSKGESKCP